MTECLAKQCEKTLTHFKRKTWKTNVDFRLEQSEGEVNTLRADVTALRAQVSGKDREIALYKEELHTTSDLLDKYKQRMVASEGQNKILEKQYEAWRHRVLSNSVSHVMWLIVV